MNCPTSALAQLPDNQLLVEVVRLAAREREATADLIASLAELDERRLYLREGYPSLFSYCTKALHLSEDAAYFRIEAARAVRRFPLALERLASGAITLTGLKLLAPHLTNDNCVALLDAAGGKSKREIEELVAGLQPRPDVASSVRKLPVRHVKFETAPAPAATQTPMAPALPPAAFACDRAEGSACRASRSIAQEMGRDGLASGPAQCKPVSTAIAPLAPERYKLQMTISADTYGRLRRAQALLRHAVPDGDPAVIFDRALLLLVEQLERQKWGARKEARVQLVPERVESAERPKDVTRPETHAGGPDLRRAGSHRSRRIPAAVKRAVWRRDGGRCSYVGAGGKRCDATSFLEFHHLVPYADGGRATADGVALLCAAHHALETARWFGETPLIR